MERQGSSRTANRRGTKEIITQFQNNKCQRQHMFRKHNTFWRELDTKIYELLWREKIK